MRHLVGVILATTALLAACTLDEAPELGEDEQEGNVSQGNVSQGNVSQGNVSQGNVSQASVDAVYGFRSTGWLNGGFKLKGSGVVQGHLVAQWDKTAPCGPFSSSLGRTCDWHTPGSAPCMAGSTVTVRAGGCAANPQQRSMIRVCAGRKPCTQAAAIASVDAACSGTTNPAVTFTCPSTGPGPLGGRYFVMVGPKYAGFGTPASSFTYTMLTQPFAFFSTALIGADFNGTTLDGLREEDPTVIRYRITADPQVLPAAEDPTGQSSFYTLTEDTAAAAPMCMGSDNRAIPLAGRWDEHGVFTDATTFTFGCTIGVIAKCYRLGYAPWATFEGHALRDYHQTCTRAARGDFCGDGGSYTVNGTTIDLYDRIELQTTQLPHDPAMSIEAVWRRDIGGETPAGVPPVCLSKTRWDTMPYDAGGQCPGLTDPRTYGDDVGYPYCHQLSAGAWWVHGEENLIITESALYDAGLWRWKRTDGGEFRSTTACTTTSDESDCVADGYDRDTHNENREDNEPVFLGAVYHTQLPANLRPANTIPLYTFYRASTGDYLTTTDASWPGYGERVLEGYIRDRSCEATNTCEGVPLELWQGNGEFVTTIPGEDPGIGYTFWKTLGYLPR